jgi:hypothetical protein
VELNSLKKQSENRPSGEASYKLIINLTCLRGRFFMANKDFEINIAQYNAVLQLKASEGDIQWNRYDAMLVVNTIIIAFMGFEYNPDFTFPEFYKKVFVFVPFLGLLLCIIWYQMTERGFIWTKFWMKEANKLESYINCIFKDYLNTIEKLDKKIDGEKVTKIIASDKNPPNPKKTKEGTLWIKYKN